MTLLLQANMARSILPTNLKASEKNLKLRKEDEVSY